jgi:hypothetical protein
MIGMSVTPFKMDQKGGRPLHPAPVCLKSRYGCFGRFGAGCCFTATVAGGPDGSFRPFASVVDLKYALFLQLMPERISNPKTTIETYIC